MNTRTSGPGASALAAQLGRARKAWDVLLARVDEAWPDVVREWKNYGAKHGWQLKMSHRKRAFVYLIPRDGSFTAATALKGEALAALRESGLPAALVDEIERGTSYPEGKAARIIVTTSTQVEQVMSLLALKAGASG